MVTSKSIVLFVDDEPAVLNAIKRSLIDEDFLAFYCESGVKALQILKANKISVLVTDIAMPYMDGIGLLRQAKEVSPDTVRIVLSGCNQLPEVLAAINQGDVFRFISKPWEVENGLLAVLHQALEYYKLQQEFKKNESALLLRNTAYQALLHQLEEQYYGCSYDLTSFKLFNDQIMEYVDQLTDYAGKNGLEAVLRLSRQIKLLREVSNKYAAVMPTILDKFTLTEVSGYLDKYVTEHIKNVRYKYKCDEQQEYECVGNYKLFRFIITTLFYLLQYEGDERKLLCTTAAEKFSSTLRLSNIVEIGYVDGAQILIDQQQVVTHECLNFYSKLFNQLGQPYNIAVTYTYVSTNVSLLSVVADFSVKGIQLSDGS